MLPSDCELVISYIYIYIYIFIIYYYILILLTLSHLRGLEKSEEKCEKNLSCRRGFEPRATGFSNSALATELRLPSTSKTLTFFLYTVE